MSLKVFTTRRQQPQTCLSASIVLGYYSIHCYSTPRTLANKEACTFHLAFPQLLYPLLCCNFCISGERIRRRHCKLTQCKDTEQRKPCNPGQCSQISESIFTFSLFFDLIMHRLRKKNNILIFLKEIL